MKKAIILSVFTIGFFLSAAGISLGQTASVAGNWDGEFNTPGGARPFKMTLVVDGEKLTGTVKRPTGDAPLSGTVKGDDINFSYTINYGGRDLTLMFIGKVSGDSMSGTISFGGQAEESWSAKRGAASNP